MFRAVLFSLMFGLGVVGLVVVAGDSPEREHASVVAEPLNCQDFESQVVCTDRRLHGEAVCARLDEATVYCTTRPPTLRSDWLVVAAAGVPRL